MLFKDFEQRFKALIDAKQLRVEMRRGQLVVEVNGDLLFDPEKAEVRTAGRGALMELARALQGLSAGRRFLVTDHADDEALKAKHYHSLWELTATRAVAVVEYLVSLGVPAASLTPREGGGSNDPLVRNDTPENRAKNRRVEIALLAATDDTPAAR